MAGFGKVVFEGEFFNTKIINVFHFRSTAWLPGQGNPFDDVLAFVDAVITEYQTTFLACMNTNYTLENVVGVGYDDQYNIVTASPLIRNVHLAGTGNSGATNGAATCGIVSLRCGSQTQINGIGTSKRNRGYIALGPLPDTEVDDYSHLTTVGANFLDNFAQHLDNTITVILPAVSLVPIRIHEKWIQAGPLKVLQWRTYSDVLGYTVRRVASFRKSRQPEA